MGLVSKCLVTVKIFGVCLLICIPLLLISIYYSEYLTIDKDSGHINNILTIFSLLIPIAIGLLIEYRMKQISIFGDAAKEYSYSIEKLQLLFWITIVCLFLLFFLSLANTEGLSGSLTITNMLFCNPPLKTFSLKSCGLLFLIFFQIILIFIFFYNLLKLSEDVLTKEIFDGLAKETDSRRLRKYFAQLCSKNDIKLAGMLVMIAIFKKKDLFLINTDEELSQSLNFIHTFGTIYESDLEDFNIDYKQIGEYSEQLYNLPLFTLINFTTFIKNIQKLESYPIGIKVLKYFLSHELPETRSEDSNIIYEYATCICYQFTDDPNLNESQRSNVLSQSLDCIMSYDLNAKKNNAINLFEHVKNPKDFLSLLEKYTSKAAEAIFKNIEQQDQELNISTLLIHAETLKFSELNNTLFFQEIGKLLSFVDHSESIFSIYIACWEMRLSQPKIPLLYQCFIDDLRKIFKCIKENSLYHYTALKLVKMFFSAHSKDALFIHNLYEFILGQLPLPTDQSPSDKNILNNSQIELCTNIINDIYIDNIQNNSILRDKITNIMELVYAYGLASKNKKGVISYHELHNNLQDAILALTPDLRSKCIKDYLDSSVDSGTARQAFFHKIIEVKFLENNLINYVIQKLSISIEKINDYQNDNGTSQQEDLSKLFLCLKFMVEKYSATYELLQYRSRLEAVLSCLKPIFHSDTKVLSKEIHNFFILDYILYTLRFMLESFYDSYSKKEIFRIGMEEHIMPGVIKGFLDKIIDDTSRTVFRNMLQDIVYKSKNQQLKKDINSLLEE